MEGRGPAGPACCASAQTRGVGESMRRGPCRAPVARSVEPGAPALTAVIASARPPRLPVLIAKAARPVLCHPQCPPRGPDAVPLALSHSPLQLCPSEKGKLRRDRAAPDPGTVMLAVSWAGQG